MGEDVMRRLIMLGCALVISATAVLSQSTAEDKEDANVSIKEVMKRAHKDKLLEKVVGGQGTDEEKKALLELYTALSLNKPPKGEQAEWKEKTDAIVKAAKAVAEGDNEALARLKGAVNCAGCHKAHKPS
jgi:putative NADH-flavin reductase